MSRPTPQIPTPTPPPPSSVDKIMIRGFRGDDSEYVAEASMYKEAHIWQAVFYKYLNVTDIPADSKEWVVLDSKGEPTMRLQPDQIFKTQYVYLPTYLRQERRYNVRGWDLNLIEQDTSIEGGIWVGRIRGAAPVVELFEAAGNIAPQIIEDGTLHDIKLDIKMHAENIYPTWANKDPNVWEEFYMPQTLYRPVEYGGRCFRIDCGICTPYGKARQKREQQQQQQQQ